VNRLREQLTEYFPALERALDVGESQGALTLLSGFAMPAALQEISHGDLVVWLKAHDVRVPTKLAARAKAAADAQQTRVHGEAVAARVVRRIVASLQALRCELAELDAEIERRFQAHPHAAVLLSLPGMGVVLAAEFLSATGGDVAVFETADRLAAVSGLAPAPRDSGRVSGNLRTAALQSPAAARRLPVRPDQRPLLPGVSGLLRPEARRGQAAHPGRARPGPPADQRAVGHASRRPLLRTRASACGHGGLNTITGGAAQSPRVTVEGRVRSRAGRARLPQASRSRPG